MYCRVGQETTLPIPPPEVVVAVFQEIGPQEVIAEEEGYPDESPPRTKGDIIGYSDNDEESIKVEDETSGEASTDNSSDEEPNNDDVESDDDIKSEIKLLPAIVDGLVIGKRLLKLWKEFMREEKHEYRNEFLYSMNCFVKMQLQETNTNNRTLC